jgi:hypothetical protein
MSKIAQLSNGRVNTPGSTDRPSLKVYVSLQDGQ